jgi:ribosomal protein S27AE
LDFSIVALARAKGKRVQASVMALPFPRDCFHTVLATEVLEHLSDQERKRGLSEMTRVARRQVVVTVPYRENIAEEQRKCSRCGMVFHAYGHTRTFARGDLKHLHDALALERCDTIVPVRKSHAVAWLYWLQHRLGGRFGWDPQARCPACGGVAMKDSGNALGIFVEHLINRINLWFPKTEDAWVLGVYRKVANAHDD